MKHRKIYTVLMSVSLILLCGGTANAEKYSGYTPISTSGSSKYSTIASTVNSWINSFDTQTATALDNRSAIIDQVENTLRAIGKHEIFDSEYDVLADALCFWLGKVADEGIAKSQYYYGHNNINSIVIPEDFFRKSSPKGCVWKLNASNVDICDGNAHNPAYGYGPILYEDCRLVLYTDLSEVRVFRGTGAKDIMFSTNGNNSKLLILGRRNHKIKLDGGNGYLDPSSYEEVLEREPYATEMPTTGTEVALNGGALLAAYTTFCNNTASSAKSRYHVKYNADDPDTDKKYIIASNGGAVSVSASWDSTKTVPNFTIDVLSFYNSSFKNNCAEGMGGAVGIHTSYLKVGVKDGYYFNDCEFIGNQTPGHGGGLTVYIDNKGGKFSMWDTDFKYNCQNKVAEAHGGGIFYRSSGLETCELFNCDFIRNYACGTTVGGGGISNQGKMVLNDCNFIGNVAANSFGGGIAANTIVANESGVMEINSQFNNCVFDGNQCTWTQDLAENGKGWEYTQPFDCERGSGGAIHLDIRREKSQSMDMVYKVSLDVLDNCIFRNNHADRNGGAVAVVTTGNMQSWLDSIPEKSQQIISNMNITSGQFIGNTVGQNLVPWTESGKHDFGGAVYLSHTNLNIGTEGGAPQSVSIANNSANKGGAIAVLDANLTLHAGEVGSSAEPNNAIVGGGIYLDGGNAVIGNGKIQYNTSSESGGGIYVKNGDFTSNGGEILSNTVNGGNGGGIYVDGGEIKLLGGIIKGNHAVSVSGIGGNGGGCFSNDGSLLLKDGQILENTAAISGGGAFINGGIVTFTNGTLKANTALNGGGIYLAPGASMTFTDGLIANNKALVGSESSNFTTAYNGGNGTGAVIGCGGGIYLQSGASSAQKTLLTINVVNNFGLYSNTADRAGDDIVAEGVNTSVTVPNVTAMDLKDFDGKDAQPNWYEDYVYIQDGDTHDSGYTGHGILSAVNENSGKRFQQMLTDGSGDFYNHLVTFDESSHAFPTSTANNDGYVCLSLGYTVLSAIIRATGLNEKENMYFTLEQLVKPDGASDWTVKNTYPVLVIGTDESSVQRVVRNLMPGTYRVKQYQVGDTPWAWAYTITDPTAGVIQKNVTKEDGIENLFPFTVQHISGEDNVLHDEEYKVNEMLNKSAIQPGVDVEDMKNDPNTHHIVF